MVRIHPDPLVAVEVFSCIIHLVKVGIVFKKDYKDGTSLRSSQAAGLKKAKDLAGKVAEFVKKKGHQVLEKNLAGSDIVITLGGDGTLIHKACELASLGTPLVGINTGNLGFLTAAEGNNWQEAVQKLIEGKYFVSERITLEAKVGPKVFRAVNEVVVKGLYRVIDVEIKVGGVKLLKVLGDGVIISTQTGSTAYSLSAGGPIVDPALDCILITPINPIGLPIPSIVLSPNDQIEVTLNKGDDVSLVLDGQEHTKVSENQTIKVSKGKYKIKFAYFDRDHFIKSLNAKFGLSGRSIG